MGSQGNEHLPQFQNFKYIKMKSLPFLIKKSCSENTKAIKKTEWRNQHTIVFLI